MNPSHNTATSGQAVVEFVMTLLLVMVVVGGLSMFFRENSGALWKKFTCDVSAPCPGCNPSAGAKNVGGLVPGASRVRCGGP